MDETNQPQQTTTAVPTPTADPIAAAPSVVQGQVVGQVPQQKSSGNKTCLVFAILGCCAAFLVIPILIVIAIVAINPAAKLKQAEENAAKTASQSAQINSTDPTISWNTLTTKTVNVGKTVGFSFKYPPSLSIKDGGLSKETTVTDDLQSVSGLSFGKMYATGRIASELVAPSQNPESILGGKKAFRRVTDQSVIYFVTSVISEQGSYVPFGFYCEINSQDTNNKLNSNDITNFQKSCDLMASTFKFL